MLLEEKITSDLKEAIKARDELRVSCLRMIKAALKNKQVERGEKLKESDIQSIVSSLIRKGQQAAGEFRKGGREDLATKEEEEIRIFTGYLPDQLNEAEIENILREIMAELSVSSPRDLGRVMKVAMGRMTGKAQGKKVNETARKLMS